MSPSRSRDASDRSPPAAAALEPGADFSISLLGQPRFVYAGRPFVFMAYRKSLPLLAYLMLREAPIDREALAFAFWPDATEETATSNLRRNLHLLLQHLPPARTGAPWIRSEGPTLRWNGPDVRFDVREFELACTERRMPDAVALYAGDFLETAYDDWIVPERERLRTMFERALRASIAEHRSRREYAVALRYADRLLALDALREDHVRLSIAMRYESGDRAGAIGAFRRFAQLLRDEIGVEPMPETTALRDAILDDADVGTIERGPGSAVASSPPETPALPFVGRATEFTALRERFERAIAGEGGAIGLCGEAGIGKTRAVTELMRLAESRGCRILTGTTSSPESVPFQAFATALRPVSALLAKSRISPMRLAELLPLVPILAAHRDDLSAFEPEPAGREGRPLHEALALAFEELGRPRPVLVVLEDLHWAGHATIDALDALRHRLGDRRVLFVATFRDEEPRNSSPLRALRRGSAPIETIALGRLPPSALGELAAAPGLAATVPPLVLTRLFERAEGHPLFLLDLVVHAGDDRKLPEAIGAAIERRLADLGPNDAIYLDIAATIGATFDIDTLVAVAGGSEREADASLDVLLRKRTIRRTSPRTGSDYASTHQLIHASAYERVDERSRTRYHRRVAAFLSERDGASSAFAPVIGHHFAAAGENERAAEAFLHASTRAERVAAFAEATSFADRALALATKPRLRVEILFVTERLSRVRDDLDRRSAVLTTLRTEVGRLDDDPALTGRLIDCEMWDAGVRNDMAGQLTAIAALDRLAAETGDARHRAAAAKARATHFHATDRHERSIEPALRALELYRELGDARESIGLLSTLASAAAALNLQADGDRWIDEAAEIARREGLRILEARIQGNRCYQLAMQQRLPECIVAAERGIELAVLAGDSDVQATSLMTLGWALRHVGRLSEAMDAQQRALDFARAIGARRNAAGALLNIAILFMRRHEHELALDAMDESENEFRHLADDSGVAIVQISRSYLSLQRDRPDLAEGHARAALSHYGDDRRDYHAVMARANIGAALFEQGRSTEALAWLEEAAQLTRELDRPADLLDVVTDLVLAHLACGSRTVCANLVTELRGLLDREPPIGQERYVSLWALAQHARASGDDALASRYLEQAMTAAAQREALARTPAAEAAAASRRFAAEIRAASESKAWPVVVLRP